VSGANAKTLICTEKDYIPAKRKLSTFLQLFALVYQKRRGLTKPVKKERIKDDDQIYDETKKKNHDTHRRCDRGAYAACCLCANRV